MFHCVIRNVSAREILDSRGNPAVMASVELIDKTIGRAAVPNGISGSNEEILTLRTHERLRYRQRCAGKAVEYVNTVVCEALQGFQAAEQSRIDRRLAELAAAADEYCQKGILAVSMAAARAASESMHIPLYRYLGGIGAGNLPVPLCHMIDGGAHTNSNLDIREFMVLPVGSQRIREQIRRTAEVYHALGGILRAEGLSAAVGDEGGYAPNLAHEEAALEYILRAIEEAGFWPGRDFMLAVNADADQWRSEGTDGYCMPKSGKRMKQEELVGYWESLCSKYPVAFLENPLAAEDCGGFRELTARIGNRVQIAGESALAADRIGNRVPSAGASALAADRVRIGEEPCERGVNTCCVKLGQQETLTAMLQSIRRLQWNGCGVVISQRSGETADTAIADIAVAVNAGQIKAGAPCRGERTAKYNRLTEIEEELAGSP